MAVSALVLNKIMCVCGVYVYKYAFRCTHIYVYFYIYAVCVCVCVHTYVERDTIVDGNQGNSNDQETFLLLIFHIHIKKIEH